MRGGGGGGKESGRERERKTLAGEVVLRLRFTNQIREVTKEQ